MLVSKTFTNGQSGKNFVCESTSVPIFMQRQVVETLTWLTSLLAWVAAINCVVIISGTAPRTLDPGPRPGNPLHLHLASQHRRVTNTRVWSTSRKNTTPSDYKYWPSDVTFSIWITRRLVCEVGIKSRCHVVTTSHVTALQVIAAVMPDVCSGVVHEVMDI